MSKATNTVVAEEGKLFWSAGRMKIFWAHQATILKTLELKTITFLHEKQADYV